MQSANHTILHSKVISDHSTSICGEGGFAPFGFTGIISGAASAFYGFVGFDVIATVGKLFYKVYLCSVWSGTVSMYSKNLDGPQEPHEKAAFTREAVTTYHQISKTNVELHFHLGEEVKDPKKAVPISIVVSLLTVFLAYCGISTVVTLDLPYFLQVRLEAPYKCWGLMIYCCFYLF